MPNAARRAVSPRRPRALPARLALAAALTACAAGARDARGDERPIVRAAWHANLHGAAVVAIGSEEGYFEEAGIRVDTRRFSAGPPEVQAILAGKIDVGFIGTGALPAAVEGRAVVVAFDCLGLAEEILARPGAGIEEPADLEGRRVLTAAGTSGEMVLRIALEEAGLGPEDVAIEHALPENAVAAFSSGSADAIALWQPLTHQVRQHVPDAVLVASGKDLWPRYVFPILWIANRDFASERPDLLRRFLHAARRAIDHRAAHLDETIRRIARFAGKPEELLRAQKDSARFIRSAEIEELFRDGTARGWLEDLAGRFRAMGQLESEAPVEEWFAPQHFVAAGDDAAVEGPAAPRDERAFGLVEGLAAAAAVVLFVGGLVWWRHRTR